MLYHPQKISKDPKERLEHWGASGFGFRLHQGVDLRSGPGAVLLQHLGGFSHQAPRNDIPQDPGNLKLGEFFIYLNFYYACNYTLYNIYNYIIYIYTYLIMYSYISFLSTFQYGVAHMQHQISEKKMEEQANPSASTKPW